MTFRSCVCESEVSQALKAGHWPEGCAPELRGHVESCASCSDLVLLTQAFHKAKIASIGEAVSGSSGLLWWKAQLRRRNAAAERVSRPITIAQTFAWLSTLVVGVILIASQYSHGIRWASWLAGLEPSKFFHASSGNSAPIDGNLILLIVPGLGALALLSGLVVYLASEKS